MLSPRPRLLPSAIRLLRPPSPRRVLAVAATKHLVRSAPDWSIAQSWAEQSKVIAPVFASEDAREGSIAFAEKRGIFKASATWDDGAFYRDVKGKKLDDATDRD